MLAFIHELTYCFCTLDSILLSYFTLFRSKLQYTLPAWKITATYANKLECAKWKFAALSLRLFLYSLQLCCCTWAAAVKYCTVTRHLFDALFFIHVFPRSKFCPSMIHNSSLQVPSCNIEISPSFLWDITIALPLDAVIVIFSDIGTLCNQITSLTHSLQQ